MSLLPTVADKLSSEVVFAGFFQVFGRELLEEYTRTGQLLRRQGRWTDRHGAGTNLGKSWSLFTISIWKTEVLLPLNTRDYGGGSTEKRIR